MTSKSKSLNKIGGLDAHFFMMSIVEEATEGGHCNTIQATQGTEISSSLSKLIEQYSCIFEMSITLPPHRGPFDHKISIKDASTLESRRILLKN